MILETVEVEDSSNFFRTNVVQDYCVACQFLTRVLVLQQVVWSKNPEPCIHALPIYQSVLVSSLKTTKARHAIIEYRKNFSPLHTFVHWVSLVFES